MVDEPKPLGYHILAEFQGIGHFTTSIVDEAAHRAGLTVLRSCSHVFEPQGLTTVLILSESHVSLHTWPEHEYAAVDIFCCGDGPEPAAKAHKFLWKLHYLLGGQYFCRVMTPRGPF
jgi:S-adenosylmethionine decarboxylase